MLESKADLQSFMDGSFARKRRVQLIDWTDVTCFYEDSEGDMNVISEDEDLVDALKYAQAKSMKALECSIVPKQQYKQFRDEQESSNLN